MPATDLQLDWLRAFVAVVDAGSLTAAAPHVHRSQSALSMQLKKLEDAVGRAVLTRGPRHLELTPTGVELLGYARRMLELHAERSNIAAAPSDLGFTFQTQEAQTQVLVEDGETAVIGGLTIIEKTESRAGIPILMNIPVVGALFRQTLERENKRDLLIMVTPHIVREGM